MCVCVCVCACVCVWVCVCVSVFFACQVVSSLSHNTCFFKGWLSLVCEPHTFKPSLLMCFAPPLAHQADQQLGINKKSVLAVVFCPGFLELSACYLRLALTTKHAVKWAIPVAVTPTKCVCVRSPLCL